MEEGGGGGGESLSAPLLGGGHGGGGVAGADGVMNIMARETSHISIASMANSVSSRVSGAAGSLRGADRWDIYASSHASPALHSGSYLASAHRSVGTGMSFQGGGGGGNGGNGVGAVGVSSHSSSTLGRSPLMAQGGGGGGGDTVRGEGFQPSGRVSYSGSDAPSPTPQ